MNRKHMYYGLLILILVVIITWASLEVIGANRKEQTYAVSVIVNDSNNDRYIAMREGLEQAARDYNLQLNYVSTGTLGNIRDEQALIEREIENDADAIVVQMIESADAQEVLGNLDATVAVMLLENDVEPEGVYAITAPDNVAIGTNLAEAVLKDYGLELSTKTIGVLCGNQKQLCMQQRLKGLSETLENEGGTLAWTLSGSSGALGSALAVKQSEEPVDILITLGNDETEVAVDFLQTEGNEWNSFKIYGEGCSEKSVYYLDKGVIELLVVPNEFNMGYQSIQAIAKQLQYRETSAESAQIDFLVIDKNNLYDEDNQKILFPIVQ